MRERVVSKLSKSGCTNITSLLLSSLYYFWSILKEQNEVCHKSCLSQMIVEISLFLW